MLFYLSESSGKATKVSFLKNPALLYNYFLGKIHFLFSAPLQKSFLIPCEAFTLTASGDDGSISLPSDCWPQRALGLAQALAAHSAHGHLPPFSLVPQQDQPCPSPVLGGCGATGCNCFLGCLADTAFPFVPLRETLPMLAWMHKYSCCLLPCFSRKAFSTFRDSGNFHYFSQHSPPPLAFGHTHCVVLT